MNMQGQHLFDTRGVRIAMIAVAAVIALAVAAYFFGTGLRADTAASVAHSPLGSSLTAVRESSSEDYVGRLINASAAARAASLAALAKSRTDFYADLNNSPAVARAAWLKLMESTGSADYAARAGGLWFDIPAAAIMASRPAGSQSSNSGSSAAVRGASLAELAGIWAPFYAGLDKAMTDAGARPAQGTSNSMAESSAEEQFQWIKPEEIKPSEIIGPAAGQNPWIKPEGIRSK